MLGIAPRYVFIALATVVAALAGCSSSSTTTGEPPPAVDGGGSPGSDGSAPACADLTGTWTISGPCGDDVCAVSQQACATSFACGGGSVSYTGSITGTNVTYAGKNASGVQGTCTGTLTGTSRIDGTCTSSSGSCAFQATKR